MLIDTTILITGTTREHHVQSSDSNGHLSDLQRGLCNKIYVQNTVNLSDEVLTGGKYQHTVSWDTRHKWLFSGMMGRAR
jgi:hypothetical protein